MLSRVTVHRTHIHTHSSRTHKEMGLLSEQERFKQVTRFKQETMIGNISKTRSVISFNGISFVPTL